MECTRLGFSGGYAVESSMAQLSPQKRKKRRVQLREAQRRRRAKLKEESKSFLQIILDRKVLLALRTYSDLVGKPLHTCATELIETGLGLHHQKLQNQQAAEQPAPQAEAVPQRDRETTKNAEQPAPPEGSVSAAPKSAGQLDLFAG